MFYANCQIDNGKVFAVDFPRKTILVKNETIFFIPDKKS